MHEEKNSKKADDEVVPEGAIPAYLMDRKGESRAKVLSNMVKQKRKEKAGKWNVPLPKVRGVAEDEVFKVVKTGTKNCERPFCHFPLFLASGTHPFLLFLITLPPFLAKQWKRMVSKVTFVGEGFTRKPPKYERFIRPMGLRFKKAHVTHPELKTTFQLPIIGVKKNPNSALFTQLGVITKGTIIEVNVSELGLVTQSGKVVWGKYAQVTNNPENDGCINSVLLV